MAVFYFILGILMFIGLVIFHEFGHYIFARRNGIEVEEFGLGFPPRAKVLATRKGTKYTLNWLPLGGFVKLKGEYDADKTPGSFGAASTWAKTKVMLAGVLMNLIGAFVLLTIVATMGMPKLLDNQFTVKSDTKVIKEVNNKGVVKVGTIEKDSPADKDGLKLDDRIVQVDSRSIDKPEALAQETARDAGRTVPIVVERDGKWKTYTVSLRTESPHLGVAPYSAETGFQIRRSTWSAPIVAIGVSKDFTVATFKGLGSAIKGLGSIFAGLFTHNTKARQHGQTEATSQVSGPVGIFTVLYEIAHQGFGLVLFVIGVISLTLAIMNVLPIPALDGGRLFVMLLYRALKKPLKKNTEERIHGTGFAVLMIIFAVITIVDIRRFF